MSETDARETDPRTATEVDTIAAQWVQRQRFWNWTERDRLELETWLNDSPAHHISYLRMNAGYEGTGRLIALRPLVTRPRGQSRLKLLASFAASIALFCALGTGLWVYSSQASQVLYETPVGDRETLLLHDGSRIELNTGTSLRIAKAGDRRKVWVDRGEAYFQIKHDPAHPFVVIGAGYRIVDLGTKFVVRDIANQLEVMLLEGSARFDTTAGSHPRSVMLGPGDALGVTGTSILLKRKSTQALADEISWRQGVLTFRYSTLADAAREFNRYNRTKIVVTDPSVAKLTVYGTFQSNDVTAFADIVQAYFKLRIRNNGNQVTISR